MFFGHPDEQLSSLDSGCRHSRRRGRIVQSLRVSSGNLFGYVHSGDLTGSGGEGQDVGVGPDARHVGPVDGDGEKR